MGSAVATGTSTESINVSSTTRGYDMHAPMGAP